MQWKREFLPTAWKSGHINSDGTYVTAWVEKRKGTLNLSYRKFGRTNNILGGANSVPVESLDEAESILFDSGALS